MSFASRRTSYLEALRRFHLFEGCQRFTRAGERGSCRSRPISARSHAFHAPSKGDRVKLRIIVLMLCGVAGVGASFAFASGGTGTAEPHLQACCCLRHGVGAAVVHGHGGQVAGATPASPAARRSRSTIGSSGQTIRFSGEGCVGTDGTVTVRRGRVLQVVTARAVVTTAVRRPPRHRTVARPHPVAITRRRRRTRRRPRMAIIRRPRPTATTRRRRRRTTTRRRRRPRTTRPAKTTSVRGRNGPRTLLIVDDGGRRPRFPTRREAAVSRRRVGSSPPRSARRGTPLPAP